MLILEGFRLSKLRYILFPPWRGMGLVNICRDATSVNVVWEVLFNTYFSLAFRWFVITCLDTFCIIVGLELVWSPHFEIHFIFLLTWERFGQQVLRSIL